MEKEKEKEIVKYKNDYYIQKRIKAGWYYFLQYYFFITLAGLLILGLGIYFNLFDIESIKESLKGIEFLNNTLGNQTN